MRRSLHGGAGGATPGEPIGGGAGARPWPRAGDRPGRQVSDDRGVSTTSPSDAAPAAGPPAPAGGRRRGGGNLRSMVISLVVIRPSWPCWWPSCPASTGSASRRSTSPGRPSRGRPRDRLADRASRGLPDGWKANAVRYVRSTDGLHDLARRLRSPDRPVHRDRADQGRDVRRGSPRRPTAAGTTGDAAGGRPDVAHIRPRRQGAEQPGAPGGRAHRRSRRSSPAPAPYDELATFAERLRPVTPG